MGLYQSFVLGYIASYEPNFVFRQFCDRSLKVDSLPISGVGAIRSSYATLKLSLRYAADRFLLEPSPIVFIVSVLMHIIVYYVRWGQEIRSFRPCIISTSSISSKAILWCKNGDILISVKLMW